MFSMVPFMVPFMVYSYVSTYVLFVVTQRMLHLEMLNSICQFLAQAEILLRNIMVLCRAERYYRFSDIS